MRHVKRAVVRNLLVGATAAGILVAGTASTQALDPEFLDCLVLMIVDPVGHASDCLPSQVPVQFNSLSGLQGGNVAGPSVTPPSTTTTTTTYSYSGTLN